MADTIDIALRRTSGASDESNSSDDAFDSLTSSVTPPSSIASSPSKPVRKRTISTGGGGDTVLRTSNRTIYTAGRPPWYNSQGQLHEAFVIGLCGGSASGKTTVANEIIKALDVPWVSLLSMDSFYKVLTPKQHDQANRNEYNFDHPDAFDFELLVETLKKLKEGKHVEVPVYNFTTHSREREMVFMVVERMAVEGFTVHHVILLGNECGPEKDLLILDVSKTMYGANVVIFEGIMAFAKKELTDVMDLKIFVDTDSDIRLARRLKRDITERGRDLEGVLKQYNKFVKPAFEQFIEPSIQHADIVVPRGAENEVAMILIVQHVHDQLKLRGFQFRSELPLAHVNQPLPDTLYVVTNTVQVQGLHTFIRNRETGRDEFIFYSQRLTRILIEYALSLLPFEDCTVETPQNTTYKGKRFKGRICGVSILRAGEVMEPALSEVCKDIRLGKILIQTNNISGEPELHYLRLPKDIKKDYVILMDATVATGAAAMMAIRVLLDHDVPQENILFLSLLVAESGVQTVAYAFPKVKIVTTAVDKEVNENFHILPGIGNFGDRYFGTGI